MLLALVFASTSMLGGFVSGPAAERFDVHVKDDSKVVVEFALGHADSNVPVPLRLTGADIDVEVEACDGPVCTPLFVLGANAVVETSAIADRGRPSLRMLPVGSALQKQHAARCCDRSEVGGRLVAIVADRLDVEVDGNTGNSGNLAIYAEPVGRLFDELPEQLNNVAGVVLVDGDGAHDDAFYAAVRRYADFGGLVSIDAAHSARLGLGATAITAEQLHQRNMAMSINSSINTFDIVLADNRRVTTIDIKPDSAPAVAGTIYVVDNGIVIVRVDGVTPIDAVADLMRARSRAIAVAPLNWSPSSDLTSGLLAGLQPQARTIPLLIWLLLTVVVTAVGARVVVRRVGGMDGPVAAAAFVVAACSASGALAVVFSLTSSSWRSVEVCVLGPGENARTRTVASARAPDFVVTDDAMHTQIATDHRTFVVAGTGRPGGATSAEVTIRVDVDVGPGHLSTSGTQHTNHFDHAIDIYAADGIVHHNVVAGGVVYAEAGVRDDDNDRLATHLGRIISSIRQQTTCGVAVFVDAAGRTTVAEGRCE